MATSVEIKSDRAPRWSSSYVPIVVGNTTGGASTDPKFEYICELYISRDSYTGSPGTFTRIAKIPQPPEPLTGYATFQLAAFIENYIRFTLLPQLGSFWYANESYIWCRVDIGFKELGTETLAVDTHTFLVWNGATQYIESPTSFGASTLFELDGSDKKLLTDHPKSGLTVDENGFYTLTFHNFGNLNIDAFAVDTYAEDGSFIQTLTYSNPWPVPSEVGTDLLAFGCGPYNLNSVFASTGTDPAITSSVAFYDVYAINSGDAISLKHRFIIDRSCPRDQAVTLAWLNRRGGLDYYTFKGTNSRSVPVKQNTYERNFGSFLSSYINGTPWSWFNYGEQGAVQGGTGGERGRTVIATKAKDTWKITTGFLSKDERKWMEQLYTSPQVFMLRDLLDGGGGYLMHLPVNVTSSPYNETVSRKNKLVSFSIDIETAYDKNIQRG